MDDFVLTKPANWTPNLAARKQALAAFQPPMVRCGSRLLLCIEFDTTCISHNVPTQDSGYWWVNGVAPAAFSNELFMGAAYKALATNASALQAMVAGDITLLEDPNEGAEGFVNKYCPAIICSTS